MNKTDTASGMVMIPSIGDYLWTYAIYVNCKQCQDHATLGAIHQADHPEH